MEDRLAKVEEAVTAKDFQLRQKFRDL